MELRRLLQNSVRELEASGVVAPRDEAGVILRAILNVDRLPTTVSEIEAGEFRTAVSRRCQGEPLAYVTGRARFWGLDMAVDARVLVPRPDTEAMVACALDLIPAPRCIADIGTGSGAIGLALMWECPALHADLTDVSEAALAVAKTNVHDWGLAEQADFYCGDLYTALPSHRRGAYDLILSNLPYAEPCDWDDLSPESRQWEPRIALSPGTSGMGLFERLAEDAPIWLASGGWLVTKIAERHVGRVADLLESAGLTSVTVRDTSRFGHGLGHPRVMAARTPF